MNIYINKNLTLFKTIATNFTVGTKDNADLYIINREDKSELQYVIDNDIKNTIITSKEELFNFYLAYSNNKLTAVHKELLSKLKKYDILKSRNEPSSNIISFDEAVIEDKDEDSYSKVIYTLACTSIAFLNKNKLSKYSFKIDLNILYTMIKSLGWNISKKEFNRILNIKSKLYTITEDELYLTSKKQIILNRDRDENYTWYKTKFVPKFNDKINFHWFMREFSIIIMSRPLATSMGWRKKHSIRTLTLEYAAKCLNTSKDNISKHISGLKKIYQYQVLTEQEFNSEKEKGNYVEKFNPHHQLHNFSKNKGQKVNNIYYKPIGIRVISNLKFVFAKVVNDKVITGSYHSTFNDEKSEMYMKNYTFRDSIPLETNFILNNLSKNTIESQQQNGTRKRIYNIVSRNKIASYFKLYSHLTLINILDVINSYNNELSNYTFKTFNLNTNFKQRTQLIGQFFRMTTQELFTTNLDGRNERKISDLEESYKRFIDMKLLTYSRLGYEIKINPKRGYDKTIDIDVMDDFNIMYYESQFVEQKLPYMDMVTIGSLSLDVIEHYTNEFNKIADTKMVVDIDTKDTIGLSLIKASIQFRDELNRLKYTESIKIKNLINKIGFDFNIKV